MCPNFASVNLLTKDKICLRYKGISFNLLHLRHYSINSLQFACLLSILFKFASNLFLICIKFFSHYFKFVSNLLQIYFKFAANSFHINFKLVTDLLQIHLEIDFKFQKHQRKTLLPKYFSKKVTNLQPVTLWKMRL